MTDMISEKMEAVSIELARETDRMIFEAFERCGYSKEWIMKPENMKRIEILTTDWDIRSARIFAIDGKQLFKVWTEIESVDISCKFYARMHVDFLTEVRD